MKKFISTVDIVDGYVSEKYDGIQGRWDGHILTTRTGGTITAPGWWLAHLPPDSLVGELWINRGCFDETLSIVTRKTPDVRWKKIKFMVFEGSVTDNPVVKMVKQRRIEARESLNKFYKTITGQGGEGIVVTTKDGEQFKKKPTDDDDGIIVGYAPGAGRNEGKVGSLVLRLRNGKMLRVSNGLTYMLRTNPPPRGTLVRFKYQGFTSKGLPRFAKFCSLRVENTLAF